MTSRREFLQQLALLMAGAGSMPLEAWAAKTAPAKGVAYKLSPWTGDDFTIGHRFRNGDVPNDFPSTPERSVDFIIVGGGMGGLTAAYQLRNHSVLLLEQYDEAGGQSRGATRRGLDYSFGPTQVATVDGASGKLYSELGIQPVKIAPTDRAFRTGKLQMPLVDKKVPNIVSRDLERFLKESAAVFKSLPQEPTPANLSAADFDKLNTTSFADVLKNYSRDFLAMVNVLAKADFCADAEQLSALSGYYMLRQMSLPSYAFQGGNSAIAQAMVKAINKADADHLNTGTFVWRITLNEDGAEVLYTSKDGQAHNVACKHVIVATPPMVAWRQISNLSDKMRASLMPFKYGSYLVANFLLNQPWKHGQYDNLIGSPSTLSAYWAADAPYLLGKTYKPSMGSVLTVFNPWQPSTEGRGLLLAGDRQAFAKSLYAQMTQLVGRLDPYLEEIVLTCWGHAMAVPGLNYFPKVAKIAANYNGPYSFAHSSTQGFPCAESAIRAGQCAADRALTMSAKASMIVERSYS